MPFLPRPVLNRRSFMVAATGSALATVISSPMLAQDSTPIATPAGGEWSFTDDLGQTITLPQAPQRLLLELTTAAALWDFGVRPVGVFGWAIDATDPQNTGPAAGNIDFTDLEIISDAATELDPEEIMLLEPDLIITLTWSPDEPGSFWGITEDIVGPIREIAPIMAISATGSAATNVERFAELAEALGVDLDSPDLVEAKTIYEDTHASFREVAAEKSDIVSGFYAINETAAYMANPGMWADLAFFQELGLNIAVPDVPEDEYWQELSLERLNEYSVDILFETTRTGYLSPDAVAELTTAKQLPAVTSDQLYPWNQDMIQSYQGMTTAMNVVTEALQASEKVTE